MNIVEETLAMYYAQHRGLPYKEVLESITLDGTQYFDTGRYKSSDEGVELRYKYTNATTTSRVYGDATGQGKRYLISRAANSAQRGYVQVGWADKWMPSEGLYPANYKTFVRIKDKILYEENDLGNTYTYTVTDSSFTTTGTILIGAGRVGSNEIQGSQVSIDFVKEYDNQWKLISDYIPVLDWNGDACLYDRVTGRMLYHKNTTGTTKPTYQRWDKIELEYLESSGTQYFDTGYTMRLTDNIKVKAQFTSAEAGRILGSWTIDNVTTFGITSTLDCAITIGDTRLATLSADTLIHEYTYDGSLKTGKIDNLSTGNTANNINDVSLYLFATHQPREINPATDFGKVRVYNSLVIGESRDFIPTRDRDGVNCMYDACYNKMYYNAGTGDFAGKVKLPDAYEAVEYLESTGTQWIDTGAVLAADTNWQLDIAFRDSEATPCGVFGVNGTDVRSYIYCTGSGYFQVGYGDNYTVTSYNISSYIDKRIIAKLAEGIIYLDDNILYQGRGFSGTGQTAYLFTMHRTDATYTPAAMRCWGCRIKGLRNFIPCVRKSDNKPGLYDLCHSICPLTGTSFYVNAGTGEFTVPSQSQP